MNSLNRQFVLDVGKRLQSRSFQMWSMSEQNGKRIFSFTGIVKIKFGDREDEANVDRKKSNGCPAGVY